MRFTVLGCDAGSKNFGYSVVEFKQKRNRVKYRVLESGELENTLSDLKEGYESSLKRFSKEIEHKIKNLGVDYIIAERYMPRGRFGNTSEYVNIMIGFLLGKNYCPVRLVTASMWKNRANKYLGKKGLDLLYKVISTPAHEFDATLQAIYLAEKITGIEIYPESLSTQKSRYRLIKRVEKCSKSRMINRQLTLVL